VQPYRDSITGINTVHTNLPIPVELRINIITLESTTLRTKSRASITATWKQCEPITWPQI